QTGDVQGARGGALHLTAQIPRAPGEASNEHQCESEEHADADAYGAREHRLLRHALSIRPRACRACARSGLLVTAASAAACPRIAVLVADPSAPELQRTG